MVLGRNVFCGRFVNRPHGVMGTVPCPGYSSKMFHGTGKPVPYNTLSHSRIKPLNLESVLYAVGDVACPSRGEIWSDMLLAQLDICPRCGHEIERTSPLDVPSGHALDAQGDVVELLEDAAEVCHHGAGILVADVGGVDDPAVPQVHHHVADLAPLGTQQEHDIPPL